MHYHCLLISLLSQVIDLVNKKQRAMKLYGIWQTDKWQAPVAMNGIVPKNDYGNVEVPPLCGSVPIGTVHLNYPYLIPVCKKLGIDFARAVVGFERTSGAIRPKIEGIVVCEVRGYKSTKESFRTVSHLETLSIGFFN